MHIRVFILALGLVSLAACRFTQQRSERAVSYYDLGTPQPMEVSPCCRERLGMGPVRSAAMLSSQTMWYREGNTSVQPKAFAISRWSAEPAALLEQYIRVALGVAETERADALPYRLRLKLESMEQQFPADGRAIVRLIVSATLIRTRDRGIVANRVFSLRQEAPDASPRGGALALADLAEQLSRELEQWVCETVEDQA